MIRKRRRRPHKKTTGEVNTPAGAQAQKQPSGGGPKSAAEPELKKTEAPAASARGTGVPPGSSRRDHPAGDGGPASEAIPPRHSVELYFDLGIFQHRCAVVQDGKMIFLEVEQEDLRLPSIFKAKVRDIVPGMNAAFVDIGLERNAYLYGDDVIISKTNAKYRHTIDKILKPDQYLMVQITKVALEDKGHRVSTRISLAGRYIVLLPNGSHLAISKQIVQIAERERLRAIVKEILSKEMGAIIRTAAVGVSQKALEEDLKDLLDRWSEIKNKYQRKRSPGEIFTSEPFVRRVIREYLGWTFEKVVVNTTEGYKSALDMARERIPDLVPKIIQHRRKKPVFDTYRLSDQIKAAGQEKVFLKSGGNLIIRELSFLTAIDVNTGSYVGHRDFSQTIMKTNIEAAEEVARQVMLRNLAGMILVDFIHLKDDRAWERLREAVKSNFRQDRLKVDVDILRDAGIVVITRKKRGLALGEYMMDECAACGGKGRVDSFYCAGTELESALKAYPDRPCVVKGSFEFLGQMLFSSQGYVNDLVKSRRNVIRFRVGEGFEFGKFEIEALQSGSLESMPKPGDMVTCFNRRKHPFDPALEVGVSDGWLIEIVPNQAPKSCLERIEITEDKTWYLRAKTAEEKKP